MGNLLKDDDCDFGLDPMTIIPRMKLRDANYVVMQAVKEGHQRFEIREEVNPETKLKIYLDSPPISYSAKPFSESEDTTYNHNWGNCKVPAIALISRTANLFKPSVF